MSRAPIDLASAARRNLVLLATKWAEGVGMFALFAVVGQVIERIGRIAAIAAGLVLPLPRSGRCASRPRPRQPREWWLGPYVSGGERLWWGRLLRKGGR